MIDILYKDLIGNKYGRLTVIKRLGSTKNKKSLFLCKCDCGKHVEIIGGNLVSGTTKSCGCYKLQLRHESANPDRRRLKRIHRMMLQRCEDKNNKSYKRYGGRGIKVCSEWHEFEPFYEWALNNGYSKELTIERKNNNGNYEPSNCCWATFEEQANNTSKNHNIEYNNEIMSISRFSKKINANVRKVNYLINRGYTPEQVIERIEKYE